MDGHANVAHRCIVGLLSGHKRVLENKSGKQSVVSFCTSMVREAGTARIPVTCVRNTFGLRCCVCAGFPHGSDLVEAAIHSEKKKKGSLHFFANA